MIALFRYVLAVLLHSQRFLPPLMLFVGIAVMFINSSDGAPVAATYGAVAGVLFACSTWFTVMLVGVEDPVHRAITTVNAGSSGTVLVATVLVALVSCLLISGLLLGLPLVVGPHTLVTPTHLAVGFLAQFTAASTGIALGLATSRLVIARHGFSLLAALALVCLFGLVQDLPPVNALVQFLTRDPHSPELLPATFAYAGVALALLVTSTAFTHHVFVRRG